METSDQSDSEKICVLCNKTEEISPFNKVREQGLATFVRTSLEKGHHVLHRSLLEIKNSGNNVFVHHDCRRIFTDKRKREFHDSTP